MNYNPYAVHAPGMQYNYQDDGLGGISGDDGLGGLGVPYVPPAQDHTSLYADDGLMFMPTDDAAPSEEPSAPGGSAAAADTQPDLDDELGDALDKAWEQAAAGADSASQPGKTPQSDDDDELTEDEVLGYSEEEEQGGRSTEAHQEDPAAAERQRQSNWTSKCYGAMTEAQRNRLEAFNRSSLQKKTMKKVLQELAGVPGNNNNVVVALCSVTKMFVGELVETARQLAAQQGHTGALLPSHIRAAHQALSEDNRVPRRGPGKPLRLY